MSKHQNEQADAGRDGQTRLSTPNSQARTGTGIYSFFLFSVNHEEDWQPYPVDLYSAITRYMLSPTRQGTCYDHIYFLGDIIRIWTVTARVGYHPPSI